MSDFLKSRLITLGGKGKTRALSIGADAPVSIQTMWKSPLVGADIHDIARKLSLLEQLGCDIVRFAVPDSASASLLCQLAEVTSMPLVADIHFDWRLALACMDGNVAKIRINPGNIGSEDRIAAVVKKAQDTHTALRIGVNSGSLPKDLQARVNDAINAGKDINQARAHALVEAASREVEFFDQLSFTTFLVSMKASSVQETVYSNEEFARKFNHPLHLGVTEAGPLIAGVVKSTLAFSSLLTRGIGSTVRVSLSDNLENEVIAAREILSECGLRKGGVRIVSCPRCGRDGFDVHGFVSRWQRELYSLNKNITVAVMGCIVNGPGEGKHADIGITGAGSEVVIFRHGEIVRRVSTKDGYTETDNAFRQELEKL
ncbi:MAG: (E)-4-hydroxy-3-methylbut-2-enyl-diphosphate synthase [Spirochaetales bacterium]|nr:(E)-4-hydroxy-3-methylbut-2-enyl-diphosphate synthase [Spirochaetales bacterium]